MNVRKYLTENALFYQPYCMLMAYRQDRRARKELNYYRNAGKRRAADVPVGEEIITYLRNRFNERGISVTPKEKGGLHTFVVFGLNNWESVLPLALAPFGRVTTFKWPGRDFYASKNEWLKEVRTLNAEMLEAFNKAYSEESIDAMVGYLSDFNTIKETLIEIGKKGVVIFNMCWDDKIYFRGSLRGQPRSIKGISSAVDLNLTNAPDSCIKYMVEGGLAMFWPEGAHPDTHKPYDVPFEFDVSFVGSKNTQREKFISKLKKMGINVGTFGKGWENGPLSEGRDGESLLK